MAHIKIISHSQIKTLCRQLRRKGKRIVFTNGCFDILHSGHVSYLTRAKEHGDILFVGVNTDNSVKKIKGAQRPINRLKDRLAVLAALECVDYLAPFSQTTPLALIQTVRPHVLIKGADYTVKEIVGASLVKRYGGKIIRVALKKGFSTSSLIKKISRNKNT